MKFTIAEWRKIKGVSQEKMAEILGIHVNTYRYWEHNPSAVTFVNARKIVGILGITLDDIFLPEESQNVIS